MNADALALAAPGFRLAPGDEIHLDVRSCDGEWISSVTFEDQFFAIDVQVWRPVTLRLGQAGPDGEIIFRQVATGQCYFTPVARTYLGDEAREFLLDLMKRGSR
jgi:hypothetical protein